ncbi:MAG: DUF1343 domain-containing protein, partial [Proteobacteria bacterium]|nr:DUF1343 domain-containing protein [Pseudomonadota bacterium]
MKVFTGLDVLIKDKNIQKSFNGNVALLCHNASIDSAFTHSALKFKEIFGSRFVKLFGPQHGFATDVQDKMSLAFALDTPINTIQYYEQIN